jgi:hypothetical protein
MTNSNPAAVSLVGQWSRVVDDPCALAYPATITFGASTYRGTRSAKQGMIWWDAGIYRVEAPNTLIIATATDELVGYAITVQGDGFAFTDANGCRVAYRRERTKG